MTSTRHRTYRTLTAAISFAALAFAVPALAQQVPPEVQARIDAMQAQIDAQQAQIDAQQKQLNDLKVSVATQYGAPAPKPAPAVAAAPIAPAAIPAAGPAPSATVAMKNGTATIATADGNFTLNVKGVFQLDAASYSQDKDLGTTVPGRDLNSGTNFRRARIGLAGKMFKDFDYSILLDFGGAGAEDVGRFHEAYLQYNGFKHSRIRLGEFAPNVGLADAGSTNASPFLERPALAEIARNFAGGDTRIGLAAFNYGDRHLWSVALTGNTVSQLNTQASGFTAANSDEQLGVAARFAGTPFRNADGLVHVGVNYSAIINPGDGGPSAATRYAVQIRDRPELRVDGTRLIDTGAINADSASATGVELGWQYKSLYAASEAFHYDVKRLNPAAGVTDPDFDGWYVEGGWVLTGEARKYNTATAAFDGIAPKANFDPANGHWGAFELVVRYSTIDLDYHADATLAADRVLGGKQNIATIGLNWQLNPGMRFVFQGQGVKIERMTGAGADIGQDYNSFAVRSQFNF
ncbi:MAG: porin [Asticcacaulis sp.]|nr:porin [Asticcacaulis sp.]